MLRLLRDLVLMPLPFALLSVFFFLGHVPRQGVFLALIALVVLIYVRPRRRSPAEGDAGEDSSDPPVGGVPGAGVGNVGGPT